MQALNMIVAYVIMSNIAKIFLFEHRKTIDLDNNKILKLYLYIPTFLKSRVK
jgi:hypothetical protein